MKRLLFLMLVAAATLGSAALLFAGDCHVPVRVTPTYGHQYNYDVQVIGIPIAPYVYSVGDDSAERDTRVAQEVVRLLRKEAEKEVAAVEPAPVATVGRSRFRLVGGNGSDIDSQVLAVVNTSCIACHKPGAAKPGVQLLTAERRLYIDADAGKEARRRQRVYESVVSGEMPKGGQPLSAAQKSLFQEWSNLK